MFSLSKNIIKLSPKSNVQTLGKRIKNKISSIFDSRIIDVIDDLENMHLICKEDGEYQTTRVWSDAMNRAHMELISEQQDMSDIRIPVIHALMDVYANDINDETLVPMVAAMIWLEEKSISS